MNTKVVFNRVEIDTEKLGTNSGVKINSVINKRMIEGLFKIDEKIRHDITVQVEHRIRDSFCCYDGYKKKGQVKLCFSCLF